MIEYFIPVGYNKWLPCTEGAALSTFGVGVSHNFPATVRVHGPNFRAVVTSKPDRSKPSLKMGSAHPIPYKK